ncbi:MAG: HIT family protein [Planctomycetes bacterium]|jgi:histidine triad (HIT) family protein|nr:HIT family protein [Planctomycetota bacterium]
MPTLFTRIIQGELPGRFVWKDELCVAFLSIEPLRPGHTLVVPRREIDHWIDVPDELHGHIAQVSKRLGHALQAAFRPAKVGVMIAGLEVRHVHWHLIPIHELGDLNFARADKQAKAADLDAAAESIRRHLG